MSGGEARLQLEEEVRLGRGEIAQVVVDAVEQLVQAAHAEEQDAQRVGVGELGRRRRHRRLAAAGLVGRRRALPASQLVHVLAVGVEDELLEVDERLEDDEREELVAEQALARATGRARLGVVEERRLAAADARVGGGGRLAARGEAIGGGGGGCIARVRVEYEHVVVAGGGGRGGRGHLALLLVVLDLLVDLEVLEHEAVDHELDEPQEVGHVEEAVDAQLPVHEREHLLDEVRQAARLAERDAQLVQLVLALVLLEHHVHGFAAAAASAARRLTVVVVVVVVAGVVAARAVAAIVAAVVVVVVVHGGRVEKGLDLVRRRLSRALVGRGAALDARRRLALLRRVVRRLERRVGRRVRRELGTGRSAARARVASARVAGAGAASTAARALLLVVRSELALLLRRLLLLVLLLLLLLMQLWLLLLLLLLL